MRWDLNSATAPNPCRAARRSRRGQVDRVEPKQTNRGSVHRDALWPGNRRELLPLGRVSRDPKPYGASLSVLATLESRRPAVLAKIHRRR